jgi:hypothetical protein
MNPETLVSLQNIPDMDYIEGNGSGGIRIGALTTLRAVELSPTIRNHYDILYEAIHQIASIQVKTMGTVVGNLCVATPASDVTPPLVALDAELEIMGSNGKKTVPVERFYKGLEQTTLEPGHIVTEIRIPAIPDSSGGTSQGLGYALWEEPVMDSKTGEVLTNDFDTYKIATTLDMPELEIVSIERPDPTGPFGAKGVGEPGCVNQAASVANAI